MARDQVNPHPDVVAERVQDEIVLVHLKTNQIYALNATAARAWELLGEGHERDAIAERLQREFDAVPDELQHEIDQLLSSLTDAGLVVRRAA